MQNKIITKVGAISADYLIKQLKAVKMKTKKEIIERINHLNEIIKDSEYCSLLRSAQSEKTILLWVLSNSK